MGSLYQRCHNCGAEYDVSWSPRDGYRKTSYTFCPECWAEWCEKMIEEKEGRVLKRLPNFIIASTKAGKKFITKGGFTWRITENLADILCKAEWAKEMGIVELFSVFDGIEKLLMKLTTITFTYNEKLFVIESVKYSITNLDLETIVRKFHDGYNYIFDKEASERFKVRGLQQFLEEEL